MRVPDDLRAALAEDLERFLACLPPRHVANPSRRERLGAWARRHRAARAALFSVALVGLTTADMAMSRAKVAAPIATASRPRPGTR